MALILIEEISLDSICLMIKNRLGIDFAQIAAELGYVERTLYRWRTGQSLYKELSKTKYRLLFKLIESLCDDNGIDFVSLFTSWFPQLKPYSDKEELKRIIKDSLDYHINSLMLADTENKIILNPKEFLESCIKSDKDIESIYMVFQSGWDWLKSKDKNLLLEQINELGINLRVIVNHQAAVKKIADTMVNPRIKKYYPSFDDNIKQWQKHACESSNVDLRISDYPILRRIYLVNYKDGTSEALLHDYAYNFVSEDDRGNFRLNNDDFLLKVFTNELNFLWDNSHTYADWSKTLPRGAEIMPSGEYVLLYLSHKKERSSGVGKKDSNAFVISALKIGENNEVQLDVNVADSMTYPLQLKAPEYTYRGFVKMTRNNIFMTLFDESESEQISVSISRPLHDQNRFLGIMTKLIPLAQPAAFKCAFIEKSLLNKLNTQQVIKILECNNNNWGENLMVLEESDINLFYSNAILNL